MTTPKDGWKDVRRSDWALILCALVLTAAAVILGAIGVAVALRGPVSQAVVLRTLAISLSGGALGILGSTSTIIFAIRLHLRSSAS